MFQPHFFTRSISDASKIFILFLFAMNLSSSFARNDKHGLNTQLINIPMTPFIIMPIFGSQDYVAKDRNGLVSVTAVASNGEPVTIIIDCKRQQAKIGGGNWQPPTNSNAVNLISFACNQSKYYPYPNSFF
jgi:hypothetical protein